MTHVLKSLGAAYDKEPAYLAAERGSIILITDDKYNQGVLWYFAADDVSL